MPERVLPLDGPTARTTSTTSGSSSQPRTRARKESVTLFVFSHTPTHTYFNNVQRISSRCSTR
jgi:hypothetical protein